MHADLSTEGMTGSPSAVGQSSAPIHGALRPTPCADSPGTCATSVRERPNRSWPAPPHHFQRPFRTARGLRSFGFEAAATVPSAISWENMRQ